MTRRKRWGLYVIGIGVALFTDDRAERDFVVRCIARILLGRLPLSAWLAFDAGDPRP